MSGGPIDDVAPHGAGGSGAAGCGDAADGADRAAGVADRGVVWRGLEARDAARCAELERVLFPGESPWPEQAFREEFAARSTIYVGCEIDGLLVGYAGLGIAGPLRDPEFEVHTVGVDPAFQGRGLGRGLMDVLLAEADRLGGPVFLEVRTDNAPAIGLYESLGFGRIGVRRGYYQPSGADAYTMRRAGVGN